MPSSPDTQPGTLYVVATPIGNLEDITMRAVRVLGSVDRILAEDTRHTGRLLAHLGIQARLTSVNEQNERRRIDQVLGQLRAGDSLALVSDAGTPGISDPGFPLVRAIRDAGLPVVPVPGASALIAAVSAAGLPTDRVYFLGFLPGRPGRRKRALQEALAQPATVALYVSPHKLARVLDLVCELAGPERLACLCRELTKVHEEFDRAPLGELADRWRDRKVKGELVLLVDRQG